MERCITAKMLWKKVQNNERYDFTVETGFDQLYLQFNNITSIFHYFKNMYNLI